MPQPVISQDIIDQVIYALRDDRATLRRCCTVSHAFLIPSRKQLFFEIKFPFPVRTMGLNSFFHALSIHPECLSYIRILRIQWLEIEIEKPHFVRLIEDLADRRGLQVFTLGMDRLWEELSVPMQAAFVRLFLSPSLHTIGLFFICGQKFPVHILGLATGLRHLDLRLGEHNRFCHHPTTASPLIPLAASHDIYLESLEMISPTFSVLDGYLSRPDCPLKISQLRELRINRTQISFCHLITAASTVMEGASRSLESLIWRVDTRRGAH